MSDTETPLDRRAKRRDAQRENNRTEILDAAEKVFGEHGIHGSLREVADLAGFSRAAIYLFFDNKQHLLFEVLSRRGGELIPLIQDAAARDEPPLRKLHSIVDMAIAFFAERPDFARVLRHLAGGTAIIGPVLAEYGEADTRFDDTMAVLAGIIEDGQRAGEVLDGDGRAMAHLYAVLINEFVLGSADRSAAGRLSPPQFHAMVDGALRGSA